LPYYAPKEGALKNCGFDNMANSRLTRLNPDGAHKVLEISSMDPENMAAAVKLCFN